MFRYGLFRNIVSLQYIYITVSKQDKQIRAQSGADKQANANQTGAGNRFRGAGPTAASDGPVGRLAAASMSEAVAFLGTLEPLVEPYARRSPPLTAKHRLQGRGARPGRMAGRSGATFSSSVSARTLSRLKSLYTFKEIRATKHNKISVLAIFTPKNFRVLLRAARI